MQAIPNEGMRRAAISQELQKWFSGAVAAGRLRKQHELAKAADITEGTLSKLLNGRPGASIDRDVLERLAAACGVNAAPALRLAGYVLPNDGDSGVPTAVADALTGWESWELDALLAVLPGLRQSFKTVRVLTNPLVAGNLEVTRPVEDDSSVSKVLDTNDEAGLNSGAFRPEGVAHERPGVGSAVARGARRLAKATEAVSRELSELSARSAGGADASRLSESGAQ